MKKLTVTVFLSGAVLMSAAAGAGSLTTKSADGQQYLSALDKSGDPVVARVLHDINETRSNVCGRGYSSDELTDIASHSEAYTRLISLASMDSSENPGGVYRDELREAFGRCS